ncbi:VIT1/CCC1 transporter family protein [Neobacillus ginsengisoli]|uniref:VIT1/CCC1 family predicted Fe2+/Mn2+ transporter n=1 Tax=Neobacillus ginsengisoli TaxID=904295 RepID=A0ABT9XXV9_9BACI|nr:VIT1/CCC1 transporter family protein [Neobacillus ginsengisoli]MDQ0200191.1 VIT1/CCC1 family predicted Fe2+/Mn2+ transporter [Neobacillus ginsengisoli]
MKQHTHVEQHFMGSDLVRDIVIGMSDGLTVPFALAAGLSGAVDSTALILTAGAAEIAAGSIAMGLGGYLAGKTDAEHYETELQREQREVIEIPEKEEEEVAEIFRTYGLDEEQIKSITATMRKKPDQWVDFMMKFELGLEKPEPSRARNSAITIAISYIVGGLVPLFPYFFISHPTIALKASVIVTLIALLVFGYIKGRFTGTSPWKSAFQTVIVGGSAAAVAFVLARLLSAH